MTTYDRPFGRYYEDFEPGDVYKHWPGKTITEYDDHLFCMITMNHHPVAHERVVRRARVRPRQEPRRRQPRVLARARHERPRRVGIGDRQPRGRVAAPTSARRSTATPSTPRPACSKSASRRPSPTAASSRSRPKGSTSAARRSATSAARSWSGNGRAVRPGAGPTTTPGPTSRLAIHRAAAEGFVAERGRLRTEPSGLPARRGRPSGHRPRAAAGRHGRRRRRGHGQADPAPHAERRPGDRRRAGGRDARPVGAHHRRGSKWWTPPSSDCRSATPVPTRSPWPRPSTGSTGRRRSASSPGSSGPAAASPSSTTSATAPFPGWRR